MRRNRKATCMELAALVAAISGPAYSQAPPCDGTYEVFFGNSMAQVAPGNSLPNADRVAQAYNNREGFVGQIIPNAKSEGIHELKVSQCGRQFVLSKGNQSMLFLQSALDETEYVAQDIGDVPGELTLRVVDHKAIAGEMKAQSHGFVGTFPVALEPRDISMPDMEGCSDDILPEEEERDETDLPVDSRLRSETLDIIADEIGLPRHLQSRYMFSPESVPQSAADIARKTPLVPGERGCTQALYETRGCFDYGPKTSRTVTATMLLDEQGRLLPITRGPDGRLRVDDPSNEDYCALERTYPPATNTLSFKLISAEGSGANYVTSRLANFPSRIVEAGYSADGIGAGRDVRVEAIDEAYQGIGAPVKGWH